MPDEEKIRLLATDGMLVKRPIIVSENTVLVGFKEEEWQNKLYFKLKKSNKYLNIYWTFSFLVVFS